MDNQEEIPSFAMPHEISEEEEEENSSRNNVEETAQAPDLLDLSVDAADENAQDLLSNPSNDLLDVPLEPVELQESQQVVSEPVSDLLDFGVFDNSPATIEPQNDNFNQDLLSMDVTTEPLIGELQDAHFVNNEGMNNVPSQITEQIDEKIVAEQEARLHADEELKARIENIEKKEELKKKHEEELEARIAAEEAARMKAESELRQRIEFEEAARAQAEEEAARVKAEEEEKARIAAAEEEAARAKAAEEEEAARVKAAEEEKARVAAAEEEAARAKAAEEEKARIAATEEEAARLAAEEEEKARIAAAAEEEEAARAKAEEEDRARVAAAAEEEAARLAAEEEEKARIAAAEEEAARVKAAEEEKARIAAATAAEEEEEEEAARLAAEEEERVRVAAEEEEKARIAAAAEEEEAARLAAEKEEEARVAAAEEEDIIIDVEKNETENDFEGEDEQLFQTAHDKESCDSSINNESHIEGNNNLDDGAILAAEEEALYNKTPEKLIAALKAHSYSPDEKKQDCLPTISPSLLEDLQESLQHQMTVRAEVEEKLRKQVAEIDEYKAKLAKFEEMQDQLDQVIGEKMQLEDEVSTLRNGREDLERREAVLSNRLNDAKKKEASKTDVAGRLEDENDALKKQLEAAKSDFKTVTVQKQKLEQSMEKLKKKCVERVKMSEAALIEERTLNDERKKKMKVFVETKAEELRQARGTSDELKSELKETKDALTTVRGKLEHMTKQYESVSTKNRELVRDMNRMKKSSEQLHQLGGNLEMELQKSAQETEEHKHKRLTAKHELMTILRKLEAEQSVSGKLRDSIKFTFTPKALSQQQLLDESLQDLESELEKLARRLGKTLPPSSAPAMNNLDVDNQSDDGTDEGKKKMNSRSEFDTARLLSTLELETQRVSKGIMAFSNAVERMNGLLDTSGEKTCASTINDIFNVLAAARGTANTNTFGPQGQGDSFEEDEDGSFAGTTPASGKKKGKHRSGEQYGLVSS